MATYVKNFFTRMEKVTEECKEAGRTDLLSLLSQIEKYVSTGAFTRSQDFGELYKYILLSDAEIESLTGIPAHGVRKRRKNYSDQLYARYGTDIFDLFYESDPVEKVKQRLDSVGQEKVKGDLVLPQVSARVRGVTYDPSLSVRDCQDEVLFLRHFSKVLLDSSLEKLDPSKLAYVVDLLNGKVGTSEEKGVLAKAISSASIQPLRVIKEGGR